jgi:LPPG:FO 2-phospho-L-lactate transferase
MSDDPVRTRVRTAEGWIDFQDYFVRQRCAPAVLQLEFRGVERARAQPSVLGALADPALRAVVICPSNPLISIEPILAVPGLRRALAECRAPVIAVSPLVGGKALKGPTAKMLGELGARRTPRECAPLPRSMAGHRHDRCGGCGCVSPRCAPTVMVTLEDRENLARAVSNSPTASAATPRTWRASGATPGATSLPSCL